MKLCVVYKTASGVNVATPTEKATLAFQMFFADREQLQLMFNHERLNVDKETSFILGHLLSWTIDSVDFEMYSAKVNQYYKLFLQIAETNKPIHGTFYPELRQRYFDLLNVKPVENAETPFEDSHLAWMLSELSKDAMSETKKHRWLGYVQGVLVMKARIVVNEERDATRDVFKGK